MAWFVIEEIIERDTYPEVEYQSRRAYSFAQKPAFWLALLQLSAVKTTPQCF
jgi:hypothetical protein